MNAITPTDPERAILLTLPRAATTPTDRAIIERGIAAGWVPSHNIARPDEPNDIGVGWLRFRAACARAELTLYGPDDQIGRYLAHRAADADAEATAREKSNRKANPWQLTATEASEIFNIEMAPAP